MPGVKNLSSEVQPSLTPLALPTIRAQASARLFGRLSLATDFAGRALGSMDHFTASEWVLTAQVPITGIRTPYGHLGDLFGWLASLGLLVLGALAVVGKEGRRPEAFHAAAQARTVAARVPRVGT
jgi:hypothetical protein